MDCSRNPMMQDAMTRCLSYLGYYIPLNSWFAMPFYVLWDLPTAGRFTRTIGRVYQYITELIEVLGAVSCVCAAPLVAGNIDVLCGCLSSCSHSLMIVAKTFHLKYYKKQFNSHLENLDTILDSNAGLSNSEIHINDFKKFYMQQSRYIRVLQGCHFSAVCMSTSMYFLPFAFQALFQFDSTLHLPIVGYIPFDVSQSSTYFCGVIFQMLVFYRYNLKMVVVDYFMMSIIVLHASQMRFLDDALLSIIKIKTQGNCPKANLLLLKWVRQHQQSYRAAQSLKPLFSTYLILQYFYTFAHTCIPAFVITSTMSWSIPQKTALIVMLTGGIMALFMLASAGTEITSVGPETEKTLYGEHLLNWGECQKAYHMFSALQKRPFHLRFISLFPLCFTTFVSVMRLIFTYYITLNEMQSMHKN